MLGKLENILLRRTNLFVQLSSSEGLRLHKLFCMGTSLNARKQRPVLSLCTKTNSPLY